MRFVWRPHTVASVGKTAGTLYALSTLGSIAGTMLTTFVLIPSFGAGAILKGLAAALLADRRRHVSLRQPRIAARGLAVALAVAARRHLRHRPNRKPRSRYGHKLVRDLNTPYHHISVVDAKVNGIDLRQLRFDRYVESTIELDPPHRTLSEYTEYFHLALAAKPETRRALFIGAGGGVGPRAFHMHDAEMEIDVVDIDQKVLDVAELDFFLEKSPKMRLIAADGRTFIRNAPDGHYDCIMLDAFTIGGRIPFHLVTTEFFTLCREKLAPGGVFIMNINSAVRGEKSQIFQSMYKTIEAAFPGVDAFALHSQHGLARRVDQHHPGRRQSRRADDARRMDQSGRRVRIRVLRRSNADADHDQGPFEDARLT